MPDSNSLPDATIILDYIEAFRRSKTMFAAISLGVFDALSNGPKSHDVLARELRANPDALKRLLDACVGLQLLRKNVGDYENAPVASTYLSKSSPNRLTGYIDYSNKVLWKLWANLEDAVREGTHRWKQTFDWDGSIFKHFFRDNDSRNEFIMGMHGLGGISSPKVVAAHDLGRFRVLVDLGGATGHLAIAACQRYQSLRAILFDLPDAIPLATEIIGRSSVANRITIVTGDFFNDPLPEGDLFVLARILHDWSGKKIIELLGKIFARLPVGGGVLIAEKLLNEEKSGPRLAQMQDLNMLVCTEGKERTLTEYEAFLKQAGFNDVVGCRLESPVDAILAIKK